MIIGAIYNKVWVCLTLCLLLVASSVAPMSASSLPDSLRDMDTAGRYICLGAERVPRVLPLDDVCAQRDETLMKAAVHTSPEGKVISRQQASLLGGQRMGIIAFVSLLVVGLCIFFRGHRIIRGKNKAMIKTIDELMECKEELYHKQEKIIRLSDQLEQMKHECASGCNSLADVDDVALPADNVPCFDVADDADNEEERGDKEEAGAALPSTAPRLTERDRVLFDRLTHAIISNQLYLQRDFSKKELLKHIHIPTNKFSLLFREFAGCSFTQYIQDHRLDFAVRLMREHPMWSLESVAKEAQMSKSAFYEQFQRKYGMKPSEFRKKESSADKQETGQKTD